MPAAAVALFFTLSVAGLGAAQAVLLLLLARPEGLVERPLALVAAYVVAYPVIFL